MQHFRGCRCVQVNLTCLDSFSIETYHNSFVFEDALEPVQNATFSSVGTHPKANASKLVWIQDGLERVYFFPPKKVKNYQHSVSELSRRIILSYDITPTYHEQQSGNFSNDSVNQDLNPWTIDYKPNITCAEPYIAGYWYYLHGSHELIVLQYLWLILLCKINIVRVFILMKSR